MTTGIALLVLSVLCIVAGLYSFLATLKLARIQSQRENATPMHVYNTTHLPVSHVSQDQAVVVSLSYSQLLALANLIDDFYTELDKPPSARLLHYPNTEGLRRVHFSIISMAINCIMSLEKV